MLSTKPSAPAHAAPAPSISHLHRSPHKRSLPCCSLNNLLDKHKIPNRHIRNRIALSDNTMCHRVNILSNCIRNNNSCCCCCCCWSFQQRM